MTKFIVTGGKGYVGKILVRRLLEAGHTVADVDWRYNLEDVSWYSTAERYIFPLDFSDCIWDFNHYDGVFHLAANSLLGPSVTDPLPYFINNVGKTAQFLKNIVKAEGKTKVIFASSAAVYGNNKFQYCQESTDAGYPINPYGLSKWYAEQILIEAAKAYGLTSVRFRPFNIAGAYGDLGQDIEQPHILTSISRAAFNNTFFEIRGSDFKTTDGTCVRDYIHVLDVVDAMILAMEKIPVDLGESLVYNLGSGLPTSNKELVANFNDVTGEDILWNYADRRPGDPEYLVADTKKLNNELGFTAKRTLKEIIESQWEYFKHENE